MILTLRVVCAWCPDASAQTAAAHAAGHRVSHSLCSSCEATLNADLDASAPVDPEFYDDVLGQGRR